MERSLKTDALMDWGVPEREFRHFVLPLRANNETLDDFRTLYADTLCARVKGATGCSLQVMRRMPLRDDF